jgi:hypothetical protein
MKPNYSSAKKKNKAKKSARKAAKRKVALEKGEGDVDMLEQQGSMVSHHDPFQLVVSCNTLNILSSYPLNRRLMLQPLQTKRN